MNYRRHELAGKIFGSWKVISFHSHSNSRSAKWLCRCSCGKEGVVFALNLRQGRSTCCKKCSKAKKTSVYAQGNKLKYLYFLKCGDYIKIGVTNNLKGRFDQINNANPLPVYYIEIMDNSPGEEELWHSIFAHRKAKGEWFLFPEGCEVT